MKKIIIVDRRSVKEINNFPREVQLKFKAIFIILENEGKLEEPDAKKLIGNIGLFEIRIKHRGQWRAIYAYLQDDNIIILSAFAKKTQKTPTCELDKAKERLFEYK